MSDVSTWDSTAANNDSASPNGFPEGMAPSGLNDASREVMAGVARWYASLQWVNAPLPASAFKPDTTDPCANLVSNDIGTIEQSYLAFDKASTERANVQFMAPENWNGGDIEVFVYWTAPTATTSGNVVWQCNLEIAGNAVALTGGVDSTQSVTDGHNGADNNNITSAMAFTTLGKSASDFITLQIARLGGDGSDTLDSDAWLLNVRARFKVADV